MNAPEIKEGIGAVTFTWLDINLQVQAKRIEDTSAELWFYGSNGHGFTNLMHVTKANMLATTTMQSLAKRLQPHGPEIEWDNVLTYVAYKTLEITRRGEDVQEVGDEPETMAIDYTLRPILEHNQPTTIYAPGGTGKSKLGVYLACLIHFNAPGIHGWFPDNPCNVLYLDWETDRKTFERIVWAVKAGLDYNKSDRIFYRRMFQPLVTDIEQVRQIVIDKQIGYIVIDSQMAATRDIRGDPSTPASEYYNSLRSLGIGSLTLDHINKEGTSYGSVTKTNRARSQYELKGAQEPGQKYIELALIHKKRNEGMLLPSFGFRVDFETNETEVLEKITFKEANVLNNPTLAKAGASIRQRARQELLHKPLTLEDLASILDEPVDTVRVTLYRYKSDFLYRKDTKTWAVLVNSQ